MRNNKLLNYFVSIPLFLTSSGSVFAADPPKLSGEKVMTMINNVSSYIFPVATIMAVGFIVLAGYKWMTSAGNPEQISSASKTLTWAVIGLVFIFISKMVLSAIYNAVVK